MEEIVILGSTGSIGQSAAAVLRSSPGKFAVAGLAAGTAGSALFAQIEEFAPRAVSVRDEAQKAILDDWLSAASRVGVDTMCGVSGLERLAVMPRNGRVLNALAGGVGTFPSLAAVKSGMTLLLANKEALVTAGALIMAEAARNSARVLPIDSEHSAIFQCLTGENRTDVSKIILTASGGPLLNMPAGKITPEIVLAHPVWRMGAKVTVDSATMVNKGLEIIEAMWLFGMALDRIGVVIHPECIIHSMVEYVDGTTKAVMSSPDMRLPVSYALNYPERVPGECGRLDFSMISSLSFQEFDPGKYPCFQLVMDAARGGGLLPAIVSTADEVAVDAFLSGRILFDDIPSVIEHALEWGRTEGAGNIEVTPESIGEYMRATRKIVPCQ